MWLLYSVGVENKALNCVQGEPGGSASSNVSLENTESRRHSVVAVELKILNVCGVDRSVVEHFCKQIKEVAGLHPFDIAFVADKSVRCMQTVLLLFKALCVAGETTTAIKITLPDRDSLSGQDQG